MTRRVLKRPAHLAALVGLAGLVAASCVRSGQVAFNPSALYAVGQGAYSTELLEGEKGPATRKGGPVAPKVTPDFKGPPSTNDWWSSLIWSFDEDPYSRPMFPHPLSARAEAGGLGVGYPDHPDVTGGSFKFPHVKDVLLGVGGLHAPDTRVRSWSDWTVTARWQDGPRSLEATFGHGLPFVYAHVQGGPARVAFAEDVASQVTILTKDGSDAPESVAFTVRGHTYAVFGPTGSTWRLEHGALVSDLAGKDFFSLAILPDAKPETLLLFRAHAYAFVTDTHVTWTAVTQSARLDVHYAPDTTLVEPGPGRVNEALLALYPHQWRSSNAHVLDASYASPSGPMRLLAAPYFDVSRPIHGVLPILPDLDDVERSNVRGLVSNVSSRSDDDLFPPGLDGKKDTYWAGKSLGRVSTLAWIAHQLGDTGATARLVHALERELTDWFDGKPPNRFYYDATWRTLIGFPAGYQSNTELNDHHFHYGYFVWAAATVAALDPAFDVPKRWGPMVEMLIKDVANWDASDTRFPRLRYMDPYEAHSWANGPAAFDGGNNEESSSEDINFAAAVELWGSVAGDLKVRDLGAYLYETTVAGIETDWFNVDKDEFPASFRHPVAGIVWGDGANFNTWWDPNPIYVHGINVLPVTGASLYLGRRPDLVARDYEELVTMNRGDVHQWRDVLWMYLALSDAKKASELLDADHYFTPEFGNSWGGVYYWISNLRAAGHVDASVLADSAHYAVFTAPGAKTYAAYNPTPYPEAVHFTDGVTLDVPPRTLSHSTKKTP